MGRASHYVKAASTLALWLSLCPNQNTARAHGVKGSVALPSMYICSSCNNQGAPHAETGAHIEVFSSRLNVIAVLQMIPIVWHKVQYQGSLSWPLLMLVNVPLLMLLRLITELTETTVHRPRTVHKYACVQRTNTIAFYVLISVTKMAFQLYWFLLELYFCPNNSCMRFELLFALTHYVRPCPFLSLFHIISYEKPISFGISYGIGIRIALCSVNYHLARSLPAGFGIWMGVAFAGSRGSHFLYEELNPKINGVVETLGSYNNLLQSLIRATGGNGGRRLQEQQFQQQGLDQLQQSEIQKLSSGADNTLSTCVAQWIEGAAAEAAAGGEDSAVAATAAAGALTNSLRKLQQLGNLLGPVQQVVTNVANQIGGSGAGDAIGQVINGAGVSNLNFWGGGPDT
jgi:hypothetical protein